MANRAHEVPNTVETQFGIASAVKGFTALTAMSLISDGALSLDTSVRALLGDVLELVDPAVTVEHLLAHTSGIGDYLDEDEMGSIDDYVLSVPVHELVTASDYLAVLQGHPMRDVPGNKFQYCNGGYVILALVIEAAGGGTYHDLLDERVFEPAGMVSTAFLRSDELPGSAALGYLHTEGLRTNVLHLPVRGVGDGGAYSTLGDITSFWGALFAGQIVARHVVQEMVGPRSQGEDERYGLGFWVKNDRDVAALEGYDAGVSFRSAFDPQTEALYTVISNTSNGAWPLAKVLDQEFPEVLGD
jgi:CubicO group peptidase (beta-lactamase class C family)